MRSFTGPSGPTSICLAFSIAALSIWRGLWKAIRISSIMIIQIMHAAPIAITITNTITTIDHDTTMDHDHHHHDHASPIHDVTVQSVSLRTGELNADKFFPWIQKITQEQGPNILRLKGILAFKNDHERYVIQGVHMIIEGDHQRAWKDGEKHESRLVFIGRELDHAALKSGLESCLA